VPSYEIGPEEAELALLTDHEERVQRAVAAIQTTTAMEGPRIAQQEVDATKPFPPVDRAEYRRHFEAYFTRWGAVFVNSSAHAPFVEKGRKPGRWPPRDIIERWVRRKFSGQMKEVGRRRRGARGMRDRWARGMAFVIARKIGTRGIEGKNVMARTELRLTPLVTEAMVRALGAE
jgi:hypothetical protein